MEKEEYKDPGRCSKLGDIGITQIAENHMEKTMEHDVETKRIPIIFLLYSYYI